MSQSHQQTEATEIHSSEKLRRILRCHKIIFTFYTESILCKLFCKLEDRVTTEYKNNIVYEIDCSNCEALSFGGSKRLLKLRSDKHKRSVRNSNFEKHEIAKQRWEVDYNFCWYHNKVVNRESKLISRKIKNIYILWRILITLTRFPI